METKLELKHLAPYLPYGLKLLNEFGDIWVMNTAIFYHNQITGIPYVKTNSNPVLRPLSDVDDDLFKEIGFSDEEGFIECVLNGDILYNNFIKLVSRHFDVFGLIPAGLAIDINTF